MSWLARSIANSLRLDDDEDNNNHQHLSPKAENNEDDSKSDPSSPTTPERGVKEDLSELKKTLTRQLWGVASFLAPPPQSQIPDPSAEHLDPEASDAEAVAGIRNDFAEIGGRFRSGISKLSSNIAVSEFSKIASNFLQLGAEEEGYGSAGGAVGVTDEVVAFVKDIAMHPETWLDFPLPDDEEDDDDFDLSDAQQEHALAVERLAPRLAALRMELCPGYMSEESFWKIYFVLLHPRLSKHDALLLSTPQVMEARASLTLELNNRNKGKQQQERSAQFISSSSEPISSPKEDISVPSNAQFESVPLDVQAIEVTTFPVNAEPETVKHQIQTSDIPIDKSVVQEGPISLSKDHNTSYVGSSSKVSEDNYEDDGDDWLKEESSEVAAPGSGTRVPIENDEDVSFSDLEDDDDDDGDVPTSYKKVTYGSDSSTKDSRDWVQLGRSSTDSTKDSNTAGAGRARNPDTKESNDWLDVDEIDVE